MTRRGRFDVKISLQKATEEASERLVHWVSSLRLMADKWDENININIYINII